MFQAATFNAKINDMELGWAESIGMNAVRVSHDVGFSPVSPAL